MLTKVFVALLAISSAASLTVPVHDTHRETLFEAAHNARQLLKDVKTGTMASVYPDSSDLSGRPFAMMEYHAPCYHNGSLTFILMPISRSTQNILRNKDHHATYTVSMPAEGIWSPMSRGRVALMGNMEFLKDLPQNEIDELSECYTTHHPDAKYWIPGRADSPHTSIWARLDTDSIYYVGGFGDTHYIGPIPVDLYAKSEKQVIKSIGAPTEEKTSKSEDTDQQQAGDWDLVRGGSEFDWMNEVEAQGQVIF
ncbi:hypothetical protein I316_01218 [Kwoniella heveanensis BCC8398]|uniref:CREG-like beta-barrel domain-containing protein n=1 Tax=Kwoniella heveanensis BCC8398 TaxID=1296120 RepID=A0A1B9H202_9TREE|nr:hypothetical protein I316_01218 [Kwoniella heveanensis BCC8398]